MTNAPYLWSSPVRSSYTKGKTTLTPCLRRSPESPCPNASPLTLKRCHRPWPVGEWSHLTHPRKKHIGTMFPAGRRSTRNTLPSHTAVPTEHSTCGGHSPSCVASHLRDGGGRGDRPVGTGKLPGKGALERLLREARLSGAFKHPSHPQKGTNSTLQPQAQIYYTNGRGRPLQRPLGSQGRDTHHPANGPTDSVGFKLAVKPACHLVNLSVKNENHKIAFKRLQL